MVGVVFTSDRERLVSGLGLGVIGFVIGAMALTALLGGEVIAATVLGLLGAVCVAFVIRSLTTLDIRRDVDRYVVRGRFSRLELPDGGAHVVELVERPVGAIVRSVPVVHLADGRRVDLGRAGVYAPRRGAGHDHLGRVVADINRRAGVDAVG